MRRVKALTLRNGLTRTSPTKMALFARIEPVPYFEAGRSIRFCAPRVEIFELKQYSTAQGVQVLGGQDQVDE
jgi:hypothetical protein